MNPRRLVAAFEKNRSGSIFDHLGDELWIRPALVVQNALDPSLAQPEKPALIGRRQNIPARSGEQAPERQAVARQIALRLYQLELKAIEPGHALGSRHPQITIAGLHHRAHDIAGQAVLGLPDADDHAGLRRQSGEAQTDGQ